jgi:excisionase family DNA binding protein
MTTPRKTSDGTYVTIAQLAAKLGVHINTVRNWIKAGHVKAVKIGHCVRIPVTEFDRLGMPRPAVKEEDSK